MMNTSSSEGVSTQLPLPVASFLYRDIADGAAPGVKDTPPEPAVGQDTNEAAAPVLSAAEINELLHIARVEAVAETERRLEKDYEARANRGAASVRQALDLFSVERKEYFLRVESDVVHLALAISEKILHREAQVDPMLVAALVRVAVDKLHDGSTVSVRVSPVEAAKWRLQLASPLNGSTITIVEDAHLGPDDCFLETDLGSANFSIEAQLKEVEQGFFDLIAQRPAIK